jgi:uncharacterized protein
MFFGKDKRPAQQKQHKPTPVQLGLWLSLTIASFVLVSSLAVIAQQKSPFSPAQATPVPLQWTEQPQSLPLSAYTMINQERIEIEVADTPDQQAMGLMFRTSLRNDRGMLFPFAPPRPVSFWMKNCLIPLDMVFIRSERVIAIVANVPPCRQDPCPSYGPKASVDQVLELAAGRAKSLGLTVGSSITILPMPDLPSANPPKP